MAYFSIRYFHIAHNALHSPYHYHPPFRLLTISQNPTIHCNFLPGIAAMVGKQGVLWGMWNWWKGCWMIAIGLLLTLIYNDRSQSMHWKDEQCTSALKKEREKPIQFFSIHISPMWNLDNTDGQYDYHKFSRIKNVHWRALPTHPNRSYTLYFVFHIILAVF